MKELILDVEARSAEELVKHKTGPGTRYVFSDHNNNPKGNIYTIMRRVDHVDRPQQHVEPHSHEFESLFIFKGNNPDFSGLEAEVLLENEWYRFESPKAVRIPRAKSHLSFHKGFWRVLEHCDHTRG